MKTILLLLFILFISFNAPAQTSKRFKVPTFTNYPVAKVTSPTRQQAIDRHCEFLWTVQLTNNPSIVQLKQKEASLLNEKSNIHHKYRNGVSILLMAGRGDTTYKGGTIPKEVHDDSDKLKQLESEVNKVRNQIATTKTNFINSARMNVTTYIDSQYLKNGRY